MQQLTGKSVQQDDVVVPFRQAGPVHRSPFKKKGGANYRGTRVSGGYVVGGYGGREPYMIFDEQVA